MATKLFPIDAAHGYVYQPTYPVSTDDYGSRQDTSELTQEILAQVPDPPNAPTPPWTSGGLRVDASGNVHVDNPSNTFSIAPHVSFWLGSVITVTYDTLYIADRSGSVFSRQVGADYFQGYGGGGGVNLQTDGGQYVRFAIDGFGHLNITSGGATWNWAAGTNKTFVIEHPTDPDRYLVHVCLEGPEAAVFYRGEASLDAGGSARVELPGYFTALVDESTATVQVTPVLDDPEDPFGPVAATRVKDGQFVVRGEPMQSVAWRVEATRRDEDAEALVVEPLKRDVNVRGNGPYRWIQPEGVRR